MTMILYGQESCTSCNEARMLLGRTPLNWRYVDVALINGYEGEIPALELETGQILYGLGQISNYIRRMGFR